jgi:hypothetical protein
LVGFGPDGFGPPFFWATATQSRPDTAIIETTADKAFHSFIGFLLLSYRDGFSPHSECSEGYVLSVLPEGLGLASKSDEADASSLLG